MIISSNQRPIAPARLESGQSSVKTQTHEESPEVDVLERSRAQSETPLPTRVQMAQIVGKASTTASLKKLWSRPIRDIVGSGAKVRGGPLLSKDGKTTFLASEAGLHALDSNTGETRWTFTAAGKGLSSNALRLPSGSILTGDSEGGIHAVDAESGDVLWAGKVPDKPTSLQLASNGSVRVGTDNNRWRVAPGPRYGGDTRTFSPGDGQYGFGLDSHQVTWTSPIPAPQSTPGNDGVFLGDERKPLVAYRRESEEPVWQRDIQTVSPPTVGNDGTLFVSSVEPARNFFALDPSNGEELWRFTSSEGHTALSGVLSEDGQTVYVAGGGPGHSGNLFALDTATGKPRWQRALDTDTRMSPRVSEGKVALVSDSHQIYVIDGKNGDILARKKAENYVFEAPDLSNGKLVLAANDSQVHAYEIPTSKE